MNKMELARQMANASVTGMKKVNDMFDGEVISMFEIAVIKAMVDNFFIEVTKDLGLKSLTELKEISNNIVNMQEIGAIKVDD